MTQTEQPIEMENGSATNYLLHFNTVINNYGEALLEGRGGERHQRASQAVDSLAAEYTLATDLLDRVRGYCRGEIERASMEGEDFHAVAEGFATTYPPLTKDLHDFCAVLDECKP